MSNQEPNTAEIPFQPNALFEAVASVSGRTPPSGDWTQLNHLSRAVLTKVTGQLRQMQATPEQVYAFPAWYATRQDIRPLESWTLPKLWVYFLASQGYTSVTISIAAMLGHTSLDVTQKYLNHFGG